MFSQPSEISDFRLRREVIIPQSDAQGAAPTLVRNGFARSGVVPCSLSRRKSWISVYGVRLFYRIWRRRSCKFLRKTGGFFTIGVEMGVGFIDVTLSGLGLVCGGLPRELVVPVRHPAPHLSFSCVKKKDGGERKSLMQPFRRRENNSQPRNTPCVAAGFGPLQEK